MLNKKDNNYGINKHMERIEKGFVEWHAGKWASRRTMYNKDIMYSTDIRLI